jgi:integrase
MASIRAIKSALTGATVYRVQVRVTGQPTQSKNFPNKKEAKAWAASLESAIRDKRDHPHLAGGKTAFAELVKRYRENQLKDVRESTRKACELHLDWWANHFAGKTIGQITPNLIAEARDLLAAGTYARGTVRTVKGNEIQPAQYPRSGATVNRYLQSLSGLFSVAMREWHLVPSNPVLTISKKKEARGRARFLSDAELGALLSACSMSSWPALHTLVMLAVSTGARRGELINLRWDDVELRPAPGASRGIVRNTKNGDSRVLPLVGKALEAMRALKLQGSARSEWVFPQPIENPSGPYVHFDGAWREALETAGLDDFRFHDLRHSCASFLAANGASLLEIADVLGHRSMSMVKRYSHLAQGHKTSVIERMVKAKGL